MTAARAGGPPALGAVLLTGGTSRRMGEDKAVQRWGGRRAVDLVADLASTVGCACVVTTGRGDFGYPSAPEPWALQGPVAGILAGLSVLPQHVGRVLVLAVDAPTLRPADIAPLVAAEGPGAAYSGCPVPLCFERALMPAAAKDDWPLRRLGERLGLSLLAPAPDLLLRLRGANTPEDRAVLIKDAGLGG